MNLHLKLQQKEEELDNLKVQVAENALRVQPWLQQEHRLKESIIRLEEEICRIKNPAVGINQVWYSHLNGHKYLMVKTQEYPIQLFTLVNLRTGAWWEDPSPDPLKGDTGVFKYLGQASEVITANTES